MVSSIVSIVGVVPIIIPIIMIIITSAAPAAAQTSNMQPKKYCIYSYIPVYIWIWPYNNYPPMKTGV